MKFKTRSFKGNKYTSVLFNTSTITGAENDVFTPASIDTEVTDVVTSVETASTKKLRSNITSTLPGTIAEDNAFNYLIIDSTILQTILDVVGESQVPLQRFIV